MSLFHCFSAGISVGRSGETTFVGRERSRARFFNWYLLLVSMVLFLTVSNAFAQNPQIQQGATGSFPSTYSEPPINGQQWDIVNPAGTVIATKTTPNNWNVSIGSGSILTVTVPSNAIVDANYKARLAGMEVVPVGDRVATQGTRRAAFAPTMRTQTVMLSMPPRVGAWRAYFDVIPVGGGSAPSAPTNLTAIAVSYSRINLSWTDTSNTESGFKIERKTGTGGTWSQIATVGANVVGYSNNGLSAATTYFYRVRAYNVVGNSPYSNEASATTWSEQSGGGGDNNYLASLTVSPSGIRGGNATTGTVTLYRNAQDTPAVILLKSNSTSAVVPHSVTIPVGQKSASFPVTTSAVSAATWVTISGTGGDWTQASTLTLIPTATDLSAQNLTVNAGKNCLFVYWTELTPGSVAGYKVYRRTGGGSSVLLTTNPIQAHGYIDTAVSSSQSYEYQIAVIGTDNTELSRSNWVSGTPLSTGPTLTWNSPPGPTASLARQVRPVATLPNGYKSEYTILFVDKEIGYESVEGTRTAPGNYISGTIDTQQLTNGTHIFQMVTFTTSGHICATPPVSVSVYNPVSNLQWDQIVKESGDGEVATVEADLPFGTEGWTVKAVSKNTGVVIQEWHGQGTKARIAVMGLVLTVPRSGPAEMPVRPQPDQQDTDDGDDEWEQPRPEPLPDPWPAPPIVYPIPKDVPLTALGLVDPVVPDDGDTPEHVEYLATAVRIAFTKREIADERFRGVVLDKIPMKFNPVLYAWLKVVMAFQVRNFYVYGHGTYIYRYPYQNGPIVDTGVMTWGKYMFVSRTLPESRWKQWKKQGFNEPINIRSLMDESGQIYNFVFLDGCFTAGGRPDLQPDPAPPAIEDPSNLPHLPVTNTWMEAFNIGDYRNGSEDYAGAFIGWNGASHNLSTKTIGGGGAYVKTAALIWRRVFWDYFGDFFTARQSMNFADYWTTPSPHYPNDPTTTGWLFAPWDLSEDFLVRRMQYLGSEDVFLQSP